MKLPVIKQLQQTCGPQQLQAALEVLEHFSEARGLSEAELDMAGELMTNICGALEVHEMVAGGMRTTDALNSFAQKVMGAVDKG